MKQCPSCDRHLFGEEPECPFCGTAQRCTTATLTNGPVSAMLASVTLALGLGVAACGPSIAVETDASSSGDVTTTSTSTTSTSTTSTSTTLTTNITVDDGPSVTSIASTTAESDSNDDCPVAFYGACPPDTGAVFECDLFAQDCRPGEKCVPWSYDGGGWDGTNCIPVASDPGAAGDACTMQDGFDDCDVGLLCWVTDLETNQWTCHSQCGGSLRAPTCPEPAQICSITDDGLLNLCLQACDPLLGDCPGGAGCYPTNSQSDFVCMWTGVEGVYGESCEYINGCSAGHACIDGSVFPACEDFACCTPYCDASLAEPCPEAELGVVCMPWFEGMAPPDHENVGACVLPPA
ncbi:hypothetical protein [Paraliomyxa miuraensis]|uniref:hypothetical protein n=1 Tax=Paraliomyxa miuraensis TaxID=376150 RepID=UPI002251D4B3|nr:hypothetical protein [Paraliomyxa miuraensis]MCX4240424.1 hypothetical protein [Paraliomyxa miuraensis]